MIATCSGQRKFPNYDDSADEDETKILQAIDNSVKFWKVSGQYQWFKYEETVTEATEKMEIEEQEEVSTVVKEEIVIEEIEETNMSA